MAMLFLATLLAASADLAAVQASPAAIQPNVEWADSRASPAAIRPNVDAPEARQALRQLSACLAEARPRWARDLLAKPYLSQGQAYDASEALDGTDRCLRGDTELTFRTSSMVGGLAEHFVRGEIGRVDLTRLTRTLARVEPRNVSEDFALCIAAANPGAARELALSEFGSDAEAAAAAQLGRYVERCSNPGENLTVDLQSLRALTSMALYRSMEVANH